MGVPVGKACLYGTSLSRLPQWIGGISTDSIIAVRIDGKRLHFAIPDSTCRTEMEPTSLARLWVRRGVMNSRENRAT